MERRTSERHKCRLECELWASGRKLTATVVDVSRGGLGIHVAHPIDQGESLRVSFALDGKPIEVEALVWRVRSARRPRDSAPSFALGTVLCEPPAEYLEAVDAHALGPGARRRASSARGGSGAGGATHACGASQPARPEAAESIPAERTFCVRARAKGNRTRSLPVDAASPEEARARAEAALGQEWSVLEVGEDRARRR
jgi:hypothetical protein